MPPIPTQEDLESGQNEQNNNCRSFPLQPSAACIPNLLRVFILHPFSLSFFMPAIIKIIIVFAAVLLATRVKLHLGFALILGGVILSLWAGVTPTATVLDLVDSVANLEFILLIVITSFIIEIGRYITGGKNANEIVGAVRRWGGKHGSLHTMMGLPAIIGLIPMPAGALFSAPFVQQTGEKVDGSPEWKSAINYWFRHIWEYWWPLYPGVITAMWLFDMIPTWKFFSVQFLFTPAAVYAGYHFLLRKHVKDLAEVKIESEGSNSRALFLMLPIAMVLIGAIGLPILIQHFYGAIGEMQLVRWWALLAGLIAALAIATIDDHRHGKHELFKAMLTWKAWNVIISLSGVLIFKHMMQESGLLPVAASELAESGMPVEIVVAFLPFIAGLVTGICLGFVGAGFPLVVALIASGSMTPVAALVLAYGFGYMGMMLSPVHLCLLVTKDYFSANLPAIYRQILPCALSVMIFSLVMHVIMRLLGW